MTASPSKDFLGKVFSSKKTNFRREDTKKAKGSKTVDRERQKKLVKREKKRIDDLKTVGNVKMPTHIITDLFKSTV